MLPLDGLMLVHGFRGPQSVAQSPEDFASPDCEWMLTDGGEQQNAALI
jgi:hypothetical protein